MALRAVARRQRQRVAELLQQRFLFGLGELAAQFLFAVGDLAADVLGQLADDVVAAGGRQRHADVVQVAIDQGSHVTRPRGCGRWRRSARAIRRPAAARCGARRRRGGRSACRACPPRAIRWSAGPASRVVAAVDTGCLRRRAGHVRPGPCAACSRRAPCAAGRGRPGPDRRAAARGAGSRTGPGRRRAGVVARGTIRLR